KPKLAAVVPLRGARSTALQFRYVFALDGDGVTTSDVTDPTRARQVGSARVTLADARRIYVARTYAYVAAGAEGLAIIDVERPELPKLVMKFTADGKLTDARDVVVGSTNASLFAYVADGANGVKVLQLTSPESQPKFYGFSPEPKPKLIAWRNTASAAPATVGPALAQPATQPATQPSSPPTTTAQPAAHPPLPYQVKDKSMGVVNCANSLCHGSVQPWKDSSILQNEYVTWSRVDKHARAYKVLSNEQSARIARNLGIGNAWEAKICVDCHAHNIPKDKRGERFRFDD